MTYKSMINTEYQIMFSYLFQMIFSNFQIEPRAMNCFSREPNCFFLSKADGKLGKTPLFPFYRFPSFLEIQDARKSLTRLVKCARNAFYLHIFFGTFFGKFAWTIKLFDFKTRSFSCWFLSLKIMQLFGINQGIIPNSRT